MVAVVSGSNLGLYNSSLAILGGAGASGSAPNGRSGDRVYVNSATGNLVIQSQDETLAALGLDLTLLRTYNAQGKLDDDNADNWKIGVYRRVYALTGTVNTAGSTVTKVFGDGSEVVYTYDTVSGKYIGSDGNGAHDILSWSTTTSQWTWTDGSARVAETYESTGKLLNAKDTDGNTLTYNYTGALLTSVADASGQTTYLDYTGNLLQKIRVVSSGVTQTLTLYTYDASNRLSTVTVDLSPSDNVVTDNNKWVTTYTYDSTSTRVASITQRYGTSANAMSSASFVYQLLNGAYRVTSFTDGEGKTTNLAYSGATVSGGQTLYLTTDVTDPLGLVTTYTKDSQGRLTSVLTPTTGGVRFEKRYAYDANGNVTSTTEDPTGLNRVTTYQYDAAGNVTLVRDNAGNTTTRTYDAANQLLTDTAYLTPDPDGAGAGSASNPFTTRYAYDSEEHLRFVISGDGRVAEYRYNAAGQRLAMLKYIGTPYSVSGLSPTTTLSESTMATWAAAQSQLGLERTDYAYDFRGSLSSSTAYLATDTSGNGVVASASVTRYVYDQRGNLLQQIDPRGELTTTDTTDYVTNYTYDGAGRLMSTSQWISSTVNGSTTTVIRLKQLLSYDDINNKVVTTYGVTETTTNGTPSSDTGLRVATAAYNHNGALTSLANGTSANATSYGTTTYLYDADNRLRVTTDPTGLSQYVIYDDSGRVVGTIDGNGTLTESVYNRANQVVKTVRYADPVPATTIATLVSGGQPANVSLATIKAAIPTTVGRASDQISRTIYDAAGRIAYQLTQAQDWTAPTVYAVTQYQYDGANRVVTVVQFKNTATVLATVDEVTGFSAPTADSANDRRARTFYDNDGNLIATLDSMGYLTENTYDTVGRLAQSTRYAAVTNSTYWASGTLAQLKSGLTVDYSNASTGFTEQGAITYYYYDDLARLIGVLDSEGVLTETAYNVAGTSYNFSGFVNVVTRYNHVDAVGNPPPPLALTYNADFATLKAGIAATDVRFSTVSGYDGAGRVVQVTERKGSSTVYADVITVNVYDAQGNLSSTTRASGTTEARQLQRIYDGMGRVIQELTAEGSAAIATVGVATAWAQYAVTHTYDLSGRRIKTTGINDNEYTGEPASYTLYYYNADNQLQYTVNREGEITEYRYNALGQLTAIVAYSKRLIATDVDAFTGGINISELTSKMSAESIANAANDGVTSYVYTLADQVQSTTTTEGAVDSDVYNVFGESTTHSTLQSTGVSTPYGRTYNRLGEVTDTQNDAGGINATMHYEYDAFGRVTRATDQYGNAFKTDYDSLGRTLNTYTALGNRHTFSYDAFSRTLTSTDYAGGSPNKTQYLYTDNIAAPSMTVTTPENVIVSTTFSRHGQKLSITVNGTITSYTYDANGNLKTTADNLPGTLESRAYDKAGRLASTTDASGTVTTLVYDAAARVLRRTVDAGTGKLNLLTVYTYDGQGRVATVTEPNGRVSTTTYDRDGRVTLLSVTNGTKTEQTQYTYDKAGHVVQVDEKNTAGTAIRTTQYTFDHLGRRTDEYVLNADVGGVLTTLHTQYKYDQNGNLVRKIDPKGNSTWFVYDADNRQIYSIDALDALGVVTGTTYDTENRVASTRRFFNTTGIPTVDRVTGFSAPGTAPTYDRLQQTVYDRDGRAAYQINDVVIGGANKAVVTRTEYDAAGNVIKTTAFATAIVAQPYTSFASVAVTGDATNDRIARTLYDARNRVDIALDAQGAITRYAYDADGNVASKTEWAVLYTNASATDAQIRTYVNGLTVSTTDHVTKSWYDAENRVRFVLDAEGYLTQTSYNDAARQQTVTVYNTKPTALGNTTTPPTIITNAADQATTTTFDTMGRVLSVLDALGATESYTYDEVGNKVSFTNKKGSTWTYAYDGNHRLTTETAPSVTVYSSTEASTLAAATSSLIAVQTAYKYDQLGNLSDRIEASNVTGQSRTTHYDYDSLGRQIKTTYPAVGYYNPTADSVNNGGTAVTRIETGSTTPMWSSVDYDTLGNAWRSTDIAGSISYKVYDKLGRVVQDIDALGYVTAHDYNAFGNEVTLTRYATSTSGAPTSGSTGVAPTAAPAGQWDRTLVKTYDKRNQVLSATQSSLALSSVSNYDPLPGANSSGGTNYSASPSTLYDYDAYGNVVRTRTGAANGLTEDIYNYFDRRNSKVATIAINKVLNQSAIGYYTGYQYDQTGDLIQQIEYSTPIATPPTTITAAPPTSANPTSAADDRITAYVYDKLNRLSQKQLVNIDASTFSGSTLNTTGTNTEVTTYGYDAVGNQTSVQVTVPTAPGGTATSYSYFDALGRTVGIAEAPRDRGDGTSVIPLTVMKRDAFGNIVEQIQYASGATSAILTGFDATSINTANVTERIQFSASTGFTITAGTGTYKAYNPDRTSRSVYDKFGRLIHSQDASGAQRLASYTKRGDLAKEWLPTTNTDPNGVSVTETVVNYYGYDKLGRLTATVQPQVVGSSPVIPVMVSSETKYNAFGEVVNKGYRGPTTVYTLATQLSDADADVNWTEKFEYDAVGRVWRSTQGDGVDRVYLYNVAGQATAVIKDDPSLSSPTDSSTDLMSLAVSYSDVASGLGAFGTLVRTETVYDLQGHSIQQRDVTFTSGSGLDPIVGTFTAGKPTGGNLLLYWPTIPPAYATRTFYYAAPGTPVNGAGWTALPVTTIAVGATQYNAVVISGLSGAFDFKVTYTRSGVTTPYAIHTGSMSVTPGSTSYTLSVTPRAAVVACATVTTVNYQSAIIQWAKASGAVSAIAEKYVNNAWQYISVNASGSFWQANVYMNIGPVPFRITEFDSNGQIVARTAGSLLNNGSSYTLVGGSAPSNITGFVNAGNGVLGWTTASSSTVLFRYRANSASAWVTLTATPWGTGFSVDLRALNGAYQYEVDYTASGATSPYAIAQGSTTVTSSTGAAIASSPTDTTSINLSATYTPLFQQDLNRWGEVLDYYDVYNNRTQYRYNERGQVAQVTQPLTTIVDTKGGTVTISSAMPTSQNFYDLNGQLIATIDANGNRNRINYNGADQVTSEVTADYTPIAGTASGTKSYVYNTFGDQVQITDALGYRTRQGYDGDGRIVQIAHEMAQPVPVTLPNGAFGTSDPYQYLFATITGTAAAGVVSQVFKYDQAGRRISETTGEIIDGSSTDETTKYWYDLLGHVIRRRDPTPTLTPQQGSTPVVHDTVYSYDPYGLGKEYQETNSLVDHNTQLWQYDAYGKLTSHTDLSGTTYTYAYDLITQLLLSRTSSVGGGGGETATYTYDSEGRVKRIAEASTAHAINNAASTNTASDVALGAVNRQTDYNYDQAGRVIREVVTEDVGQATQAVHQDTTVAYDELGRMTQISDPRYTLVYSYDAEGNRTHIVGSYLYQAPNSDLWYTYDGANRVLISQGSATGSTVSIGAGVGTTLTYNARGDRASATRKAGGYIGVSIRDNSTGQYWKANTADDVQQYTYDALGRLTNIAQQTYQAPNTSGAITTLGWQNIDTRTYDRASRQFTQQTVNLEYGTSSWLWVTRVTTTSYDDDGRLVTQTETKNGVKEYTQLYGNGDADFPGSTGSFTYNGVTYTWPIAAGYGIGYDSMGNLRGYTLQVFDSGGSVAYYSTYTIKYRAADAFQEITTAVSSSPGTSAAPAAGSTTRGYDTNNELVQFDDAQAATKSRYFASNAAGQAITVVQGQYDGASGRWTGAQALAAAGAISGAAVAAREFIVQGQVVGTTNLSSAKFDVNYTPISNQYPGSTAPSVIVQSDDTLRIIATRIWGDGDLWYLIAQENGLTDPDGALTAGTELKLPNSVVSLKNNSTTFKPYDVSKVIGDSTPTQPAPPPPKGDNGCGVIGLVLMIVVAIIVTVYTAGAAGAAFAGNTAIAGATGAGATLGTAGAWAAGTAVLGGAAGASTAVIAAAAIGGAVGSIASQLVGMATGNVDGFDWKGVALGAVAAGVGAGLGGSTSFATALQKVPAGTLRTAVVGATSSALTQGIAVVTGVQSSFSWKDVAISAVAAPVANKVNHSVGTAFRSQFAGQFAGSVAGSLVRGAFGGKVDFTTVIADAFGHALGNSLVDLATGAPVVTHSSEDSLQEIHLTVNKLDVKSDNTTLSPGDLVTPDMLALSDEQLKANLASLANIPVPRLLVTAQPGDTVTGFVGNGATAVGNFERLNGLTPDHAYLKAGQTYILSDPSANIPESESRAAGLATYANQSADQKRQAEAQAAQMATASDLEDPYSFSGTLRAAQQLGVSMEDVVTARNAADYVPSKGDILPMNPVDGFLMNHPIAQEALGFLTAVVDIINTPRTLGDGLQNMELDVWGFTKSAITGGSYQAQNGIVRLYQQEGAGAGTVDLIGGVVKSLPGISVIAAGNDPFLQGRALAGTIGGLAALSELAPISTFAAESDAVRVAPYGDLVDELKWTGLQAHHLNQNAAFRDIIPRDDGLAIGMRGNAFTEVGSAHYEFHSSLEDFWAPYRDVDSELFGLRPTNGEYGAAVESALVQSGYTPSQTAIVAEQAAAQRSAYGLTPATLVPRVPGRIPQVPGGI